MALQDISLTPLEVESSLWQRLEIALRAELDDLRRSNDSIALNIADTTAKRGEIRMVKRILAIADEARQEARQDGSANGPELAISRLIGGFQSED